MSLAPKALAAVLVAAPVTAETYRGYETPAYTVEAQIAEVEIRAYAPHLLAQVSVEGTNRQARGLGFRLLAGYIFGGNATGDKVAMTSPVAQSQVSGAGGPSQANPDAWTITFMMPSEYSVETLPLPNHPAIEIVEAPANRQAVITFSGMWTDRLRDREEARLRAVLAEAGIETTGPARYYFYDDPSTLPWNRRNEVALVIAD